MFANVHLAFLRKWRPKENMLAYKLDLEVKCTKATLCCRAVESGDLKKISPIFQIDGKVENCPQVWVITYAVYP